MSRTRKLEAGAEYDMLAKRARDIKARLKTDKDCDFGKGRLKREYHDICDQLLSRFI
jgi:hypothetical protein